MQKLKTLLENLCTVWEKKLSSSVIVCHSLWRSLWPRQVKTQILVKGRNCPGHKGTESEPPIVMADVWGANFGHLYPTSVPDDWRRRCFMRPICLIAPSPTVLSRLSLWKQDPKDISLAPLYSSKYFHWVCTILVRRLAGTRHCVKREADVCISQCPTLLWEPSNTFPHSGQKPNKCNHCD